MLEDGTAIRASDIDVAMVVRFGWPTYTGGPMFWAETIGIRNVCAALMDMQRSHGDAFRPALLLEKLSRSNRGFQDP
jgi:3-hydroxyacyl-CoA dehydrogenase